MRILIRGLKSKLYFFNKFIILKFYIYSTLLDRVIYIAKIIREIYVISDLKVDILIRSNILTLE